MTTALGWATACRIGIREDKYLFRDGYAEDLKPLSGFVIRFNNGKADNNPIKLLQKNIGSPAELDALLAAHATL